jgi:3-hydroxybutyryl-CoA dehydrogenase
MSVELKTKDITIGVIGLGLMGSSIVTSLLISGHRVKGIAPLQEDMEEGPSRICEQLAICGELHLLQHSIKSYLSKLTISENYSELSDCSLVLECVTENIEIKKQVFEKILGVVNSYTIIASNTSANSISELQKFVHHPERFLGIHWAEPAFATRFLEITCGEQTSHSCANWVFELAHHWDKEPTILRKDIRGFITNRLMYAMYREALFLIDKNEVSIEDVDKFFKYDAGSWITLMGIFKRMDFMGLNGYLEIFNTLFPKLCNADDVSRIMQQKVLINARGTQSPEGEGLYKYTAEEVKNWNEAFVLFNQDIYQLAKLYPFRKGEKVTASGILSDSNLYQNLL